MENEQLSQALSELWDSLTDEQKEKARACTSFDELMECVGEEGIELPLEVLEGVVGGYTYYDQSTHTYEIIDDETGDVVEGGYVYLDNAQAQAQRYRLSPDLLTWDELRALRNRGKGGGC